MNMDLSSYYSVSAMNFDKNRLDNDEEIIRHCAWFAENISKRNLLHLDIGCGTGRYTQEFLRLGLTAIGIDSSEHQVLIAARKVPAILGAAEALPFGNGVFDQVSFIMMIQQLAEDNIMVAAREASRVTKNGGRVLIKTCSDRDLEKRPFNRFFPSSYKINVSRYPKINKVKNIFSRIGFSLTREKVMIDCYKLTGLEIKRRFEEKHNSTLFLLDDQEFMRGLFEIKNEFDNDIIYQFKHQHTLLEFEKK